MHIGKTENEQFFSLIPFSFRNSVVKFIAETKKCMKNYTNISEFVENFTVPLAFLRKSGILRLYSDADFSVFVVRMDMH